MLDKYKFIFDIFDNKRRIGILKNGKKINCIPNINRVEWIKASDVIDQVVSAEIWVVEQCVRGTYDIREKNWKEGSCVFEVQGVFDSEEKAIAACRDENYYIFPLNLNESLPHESVKIENGRYPLAKNGDNE